ncbi:MAG: GC-type dockerin domain-anchored protein [Phycisphaerales bacterium]
MLASLRRTTPLAAALALCAPALAAPPEYTIIDIGIVNVGDSGSQGFACSPGGVAVGRSLGGSGSSAYSWTQGGGRVDLPNLASPARAYGVSNSANDSGIVVGTGSATFFGSNPLPIMWNNGVVSQLPLPAGQTLGRANGVNASGVAVGSVNGGSLERACLYAEGIGTVITTTTSNGSFMTTAYGINDSGLVVGNGIDPNNAAVNVGMVYNSVADTATTVGALPGRNGALCFAVSNAGHVTGSSMLNQGSGTPFVWTQAGGIVEIPLPPDATTGSGRGVNSDGWVVGNAGGVFAVPFLYDGTSTYAIADLLPADATDWDLNMNTSSSAQGISEDGIIIGTGVHNGEVRAYALIPVAGGCNGADLAEPFGQLDFSDVVAFLVAFGNMEAAADLAEPFGQWDFSDVVTFLTEFGSGCP